MVIKLITLIFDEVTLMLLSASSSKRKHQQICDKFNMMTKVYNIIVLKYSMAPMFLLGEKVSFQE